MNYYRRYVGDYLRDTARLSILEHGAYNLLLDYYYAEERPIPLELDEVYRMVRAITPEERRAVVKVLTTYFVRTDEGYRNTRADREIETSQKARSNGAKGGRPVTGSGTDEITGPVTDLLTEPGGGSVHPPTTNHQPPAVQPPTAGKALAPSAAHSTPPRRNGHARTPEDTGPVVERIPLNDGTDFEVQQSFVEELARLFPAVDVPQTLREIRAWNLAKPARRKTRKGVKAHLVTWCGREQDKAGGGGVRH